MHVTNAVPPIFVIEICADITMVRYYHFLLKKSTAMFANVRNILSILTSTSLYLASRCIVYSLIALFSCNPDPDNPDVGYYDIGYVDVFLSRISVNWVYRYFDIVYLEFSLSQTVFTDCKDIMRVRGSPKSGVYTVNLWQSKRTINVYCDMDTDNGGWTVSHSFV